MTSFDPITQPLEGAHSIEASAGTGKTYSITLLWLRLIVEKELTVPQILVSTFTQAATAELKDRLLASLRRALAAAQDLQNSESDSPSPLLSTSSPESEIVRRYSSQTSHPLESLTRRLNAALSSFDLAPITTLHGFCQSLLSRHALEIGCDPALALVDTSEELLEDLFNDEATGLADSQPLELEKLRSVARAVAQNPNAQLQLSDSPSPSRTIAEAIHQKLPERKNAAALRYFDDILQIVRNALRLESQNGPLANAVRHRLKAAIIDECQDSDNVQIEVFQALFLHPQTLSFLVIGDPKQSIYRFRGADLTSYKKLTTSQGFTQALPMTVNHRSDPPLLNALNDLYSPSFLFPDSLCPDSPTPYIPVTPQASQSRLNDPHLQTGLVFLASSQTQRDRAKLDLARQVAAECQRLLQNGTHLEDRHAKDPSKTLRPLRPSDLAILAGKRADLQLLRRQLLALQIPAQIAGRSSQTIFQTEEASDLLAWLEVFSCIEGRSRSSLLSKLLAFLSTPLGGFGPHDLLQLPQKPHLQAELASRFQNLLPKLHTSGPLPLLLLFLAQTEHLHAHLPFLEGERRLTNWRQTGLLLQHQHARGLRSAQLLTQWLNRQIASPDLSPDSDESEALPQKLDSDADAVQLQTIHSSKGLEYPIVFCPFLWDLPSRARYRSKPALFRSSLGWQLDIDSVNAEQNVKTALQQESEEAHRLLYVALTRARHRLYLGAASIPGKAPHNNGSHQSALAHLLTHRIPSCPLQTPDDWIQLLSSVPHSQLLIPSSIPSSASLPPIKQTAHAPLSPSLSSAPSPLPPRPSIWRKISFTALSRSKGELYQPLPMDSTEDPLGAADRDEESPELMDPQLDPGLLRPLGSGGTDLGDLLHRVLEGYLGNGDPLPSLLPTDANPETWAAILTQILEQPLPLAPNQSVKLSQLQHRCITEMQFHLPIDHLHPERLSNALLQDPNIADNPARQRWAHSIQKWEFGRLHGFLQGFIDLLFEHNGRWYVVDYKSNQLPNYQHESLEEKMIQTDYLLQARLYAAALHRHLQAQLTDYRPDLHFGGLLYLFVRGFPEHGIWSDFPSPDALHAMDAVFTPPLP